MIHLSIKKLLPSILTVTLLICIKTSHADLSDGWKWKLGDEYAETLIRMDHLQDSQCKKDRVYVEDSLPFLGDWITDKSNAKYKYLKHPKEQYVVVSHVDWDDDCEPKRSYELSFCKSTGKLALMRKLIWLSEESFKPFYYGEEEYVGFDLSNQELLMANFYPRGNIHIEVYDKESRSIRHSFVEAKYMGRPRITHRLFMPPDGMRLYRDMEICPSGEEKISSKDRPIFHSLEKIIYIFESTHGRYQRGKAVVQKCIIERPNKRRAFEKYWKRYTRLNGSLIDDLAFKTELVVNSVDVDSITKRYENARTRSEKFNIFAHECEYLEDRLAKVKPIKTDYLKQEIDSILNLSFD